jgi:4-hydroxy-4-methyl-2-oxoglutarate aldolase
VRDVQELDELDFPVFSVGSNPNGPTKNVPGRIGHPIACGGVTVNAGDFVCADADGVVVVEREKLASLLAAAEHKVKAEASRIAQIKQGKTAAVWLNDALVQAGVLKLGETL